MTWALVTGASAGLGVEFAKLFARDRINLILVARRQERLDTLAEGLRHAHGIETLVISQDLGTPSAAETIYERLDKEGIAPEFLVNNAGFGGVGAFAKRALEDELQMVQVNISALIALTRLLLPSMREHQWGRILNIGSTAGFQPGPYMNVYYATKAFVNAFSEALMWELKDTGVTVTLSCPGPTLTEFSKVARGEASKLFLRQAMSAEVVARQAYQAMNKGKRRVVHGLQNKIGAALSPILPRRAVLSMVASLNQG